jgi:hypothetical protein
MFFNRAIFITIIFFLNSFFLIYTTSTLKAATATPVIFYSDLTSGPNTGGQNNKGVFVTIWGKNFGNTRENSYVTVGGGQADNYPEWTNSKVCFQLGASTTTGNIIVIVGGVPSNTIPFTVRPGNIYFVTPDGTGDGSYASPFDPSDYTAILAGGENGATAYFRTGTYTQEYAYLNWHANFCFTDNYSGSPGNENAFIGYPGETIIINALSGSADRTNFRSHDTSIATNILIAKFICNSVNGSISSRSGWRVVGNYIDGISTLSADGVISAKGSDIKILGNEITGGSSGNKLDHAFYPNEGSDIEFGWNHIHDNNFAEGPMISINHDSAWINNWQFLNYHIHDNIIDVSTYPSRAMGVYETGPDSTIYYYNNVVVGHPANGLSTIMAASAHVYYYNNTIYDAGYSNSPVFDFYGVSIHDHNYVPLSITLKNNIIYANTNTNYYVRSTSPAPTPSQEANCYYGIGSYASHNLGGGVDSMAVESDPLFVNSSLGDFHLRSNSPAINAGVDLSVYFDYFDISIPQDTRFDIGAFEYEIKIIINKIDMK